MRCASDGAHGQPVLPSDERMRHPVPLTRCSLAPEVADYVAVTFPNKLLFPQCKSAVRGPTLGALRADRAHAPPAVVGLKVVKVAGASC